MSFAADSESHLAITGFPTLACFDASTSVVARRRVVSRKVGPPRRRSPRRSLLSDIESLGFRHPLELSHSCRLAVPVAPTSLPFSRTKRVLELDRSLGLASTLSPPASSYTAQQHVKEGVHYQVDLDRAAMSHQQLAADRFVLHRKRAPPVAAAADTTTAVVGAAQVATATALATTPAAAVDTAAVASELHSISARVPGRTRARRRVQCGMFGLTADSARARTLPLR